MVDSNCAIRSSISTCGEIRASESNTPRAAIRLTAGFSLSSNLSSARTARSDVRASMAVVRDMIRPRALATWRQKPSSRSRRCTVAHAKSPPSRPLFAMARPGRQGHDQLQFVSVFRHLTSPLARVTISEQMSSYEITSDLSSFRRKVCRLCRPVTGGQGGGVKMLFPGQNPTNSDSTRFHRGKWPCEKSDGRHRGRKMGPESGKMDEKRRKAVIFRAVRPRISRDRAGVPPLGGVSSLSAG